MNYKITAVMVNDGKRTLIVETRDSLADAVLAKAYMEAWPNVYCPLIERVTS